MGSPVYRALDVIHRGLLPEVQPGEELPAFFVNSLGEEEPYDIDRLLEHGLIEPATAAAKREKATEKSESEPEKSESPAPAKPEAPSEPAAKASPTGDSGAKAAPKRAPRRSRSKRAAK
jgi:hypothetical protein